jgi:flagellar biosynthesis protein FliQ
VHDLLLSTLTEALYLALWISLPALAVGLVVAVTVSLLQAFSQLAEPVINAIPRSLAVGLSLALAGSWMGGQLAAFAARIFQALPELVR